MLGYGVVNGVDTCWFDWKGQEKEYEPTYVIKSLQEIFGVLG